MELLSKEEAQKLFLDKLGRDVFNTPDLKVIAEEVLERCAQLPLAIVTIAASFKCLIHDFEWRDALEDLKTSVKGSNNIEAEKVVIEEYDLEEKFVKMHDLMKENGGEDLVKASLMYNNISRIPPNASPMCPKLSTLLLQGNESLKDVPDSLFEHLHGLNILDLSEYRILIFFSDMKLEEVASLKNLETFGGRFSDMYEFSTYMEKGQLATYEIHVGSIAQFTRLNQGQKDLYWTRGEVSGFRASLKGRDSREPIRVVWLADPKWQEKVEIPVRVNGCKLILTTRLLDACRRLGCQVKIKVEPFSKEEAWSLFLEKVGYGVALPPEVTDIARSVAKECAGLPLAITVPAGSMRGVDDICERRNTLEILKESKVGQDDMELRFFKY
uniref:NB-ARC domain-containing protein n=1 Tax=Fagus sylvatica TaxID=28930 RepID=A0A2N9I5R4_FAGSY